MKIILCGDMAVTDESIKSFQVADEQKAFGDTLEVLKSGDFTFVNLECAITESNQGIDKIGPCIKGPLKTAETLKKAGVTHCLLSNNHIFDFGKPGLDDTIKELEKAGIEYTGIGNNYEDSRKNLVIEKDGIKVSIINVCEHEYSYATDKRIGARPFDEFETMHDIRMAKKESDKVIVVYHGGKEYCHYPSPRLLKACREMVRCGADAVFCQHSHIIGCYEFFEGGHIVYGQGNFHFVEVESGESYNEGLIAEIDITKNEVLINFIPVIVDGEGIILAKGDRKNAMLSGMKERNEEILNGMWETKWAEFCEGVAPWYDGVRIGEKTENEFVDSKQMFSHYLDCEAHRDVWLQLFKTWNKTGNMNN